MPWTGEPGGLIVHGITKKIGHDLVTKQRQLEVGPRQGSSICSLQVTPRTSDLGHECKILTGLSSKP